MLRGCYVAFKADLKARVQVHALTRSYLCNLIFGLGGKSFEVAPKIALYLFRGTVDQQL